MIDLKTELEKFSPIDVDKNITVGEDELKDMIDLLSELTKDDSK